MADPVFFVPSRVWSAAEVAGLTGAILHDPAHGEVVVSRLASLAEGGDGTLVFIDGKRHLPDLKRLRAAAVFCSEDVAPSVPPGIAILLTPSPQKAFVAVARAMFPASLLPDPVMPVSGVSPAAHVDPTARLEPGTVVDAGAVVGPGVSIGTQTVVAANAVIGRNCQVGRGCRIGPNVTIQHALIGDGVIIHPGACIGQDGFGYLPGGQGAVKIPQLGRVVVQNDVEIGANTTIDRGALADTIIGEGTKIDNLVQIGHNVRIGRHCLIAGHVGIAGSTTLGDGVQVGGRAGISDHLNIGAGARLAAASAFMRDVPPGEVWGGVPAQRMTDALREINAIRKFAKAGAKKE